MRKFFVIVVGCLLSGSLAACGSTGSSSGGDSKLNIAYFSAIQGNSFADALYEGVKEQGAKEGAEVTLFDSNQDLNAQASQIKAAISSRKFDAFVIFPLDGAGLLPVVKQAVDSGIPTVCVFTACGKDPNGTKVQLEGLVAQIGVDFVKQGDAIGVTVVSACEDIDPCEVAYIPGLLTTPIDEYRTKAFLDRVATAENIEVVASDQAGQSQVELARKITQTILTANPGLDVLAAAGDQMALGAQRAIESREGTEVKIIGLGGSKVGAEAVADGVWFATAGPNFPKSEGVAGVKAAVAAARGDETRDQIILETSLGTDAPAIDSTNVNEFEPEWNGS